MAKETENLDSPKEETDEQEELEKGVKPEEGDDSDVLKEKLEKVKGLNAQLFERAKKAEGFVKDDSGKWVKKPVEQEKPKPKETPATNEELEDKKLDERLDAKLEKRELAGFEISDSLKKEVGAYAKLNGVPVKEALASPYIQFRVGEEGEAEKTEEASLGGGKGRTAKEDLDQNEPGTFDLSTKEGKEKFKKWEVKIKKDLG